MKITRTGSSSLRDMAMIHVKKHITFKFLSYSTSVPLINMCMNYYIVESVCQAGSLAIIDFAAEFAVFASSP